MPTSRCLHTATVPVIRVRVRVIRLGLLGLGAGKNTYYSQAVCPILEQVPCPVARNPDAEYTVS